eukprot:2660275-Rhodomonas_salina.2
MVVLTGRMVVLTERMVLPGLLGKNKQGDAMFDSLKHGMVLGGLVPLPYLPRTNCCTPLCSYYAISSANCAYHPMRLLRHLWYHSKEMLARIVLPGLVQSSWYPSMSEVALALAYAARHFTVLIWPMLPRDSLY